MNANEIADCVEFNTDKWTLLGNAADQSTLDIAQLYANLKKAVIAVQYNSSGRGHVALIMPGMFKYSGNWSLNCPKSASFFLNIRQEPFLSKKLSHAFQTPNNVKIYGRNF